jgi:hypothetical protein
MLCWFLFQMRVTGVSISSQLCAGTKPFTYVANQEQLVSVRLILRRMVDGATVVPPHRVGLDYRQSSISLA